MLASFDWSYIADHLPELWQGLLRTLEASAIGIAGSFLVGSVLGAARCSSQIRWRN